MDLSEQFSEYRGQHQPDLEGPAIHEIDQLFPSDVYDRPDLYAHGDPRTAREAGRALQRSRGNPEAQVDVYRAVPHGVEGINPGDWVTTSPSYARQHGRHATDPAQDWPVLSARVAAQHVRTGGNDVIEWGYTGPAVEKARVHWKRR